METRIEFDTLTKLAPLWDQAPRIVAEEQYRGMARAVLPIEARAKAEAPWDTGHLRRSLTHRIERGQFFVTGIVGTNVLYARVVEEGRAAGTHMPPGGVLLGWMRRKGIDETLEYPLRRVIGRHGTKAQPYLIPAFKAGLRNAHLELGPLTCQRVIARMKAGKG